MDRDLRRGYLEPATTGPRFDSPIGLLTRAFRLFFSRFGFIAGVTLLVYLPGHALYQLAASVLEIPSNGILSFLLLDTLDLVLSSLAIPAVVYGLLHAGTAGPAMRWGRRQWLRTLGQQTVVDITVVLYGFLLIVPGLVMMVRLAFVPVVIAIEGDRAAQPRERSRELSRGRMWRMVAVLLPLGLVDFAANFLLLGRMSGVDNARVIFTLAECGLAIIAQISTVATLLMYLGTVEPPQRKTAKL